MHTDNLSERKVADSMAHRKVFWLPALIAALILVTMVSPFTLAKNPSPEELTEPVVVRLYVRVSY